LDSPSTAPAFFSGAVAAFPVAATPRRSAAGFATTSGLTAAAVGVTGLTPFLEDAAEFILDDSAFPAALDGAGPRFALEFVLDSTA
jgi:hypothetical protein